MQSKCEKCNKKLEDPNLTHCSNECLFAGIMNSKSIDIPIKAWYGDEEMALEFPEGWSVQECRMAGHDAAAMNDDQIRQALAVDHPRHKGILGTQPHRCVGADPRFFGQAAKCLCQT